MKSLQRVCAGITFAVLLLATGGCSLLAPQLDKAAEGAGKLVTFYCENVTDAALREEFRAAVNAKAQPHSVTVTCAQGGVPLTIHGTPTTTTSGVNPMPTSNPHEIARMKRTAANLAATAAAAPPPVDVNEMAKFIDELTAENVSLKEMVHELGAEVHDLRNQIASTRVQSFDALRAMAPADASLNHDATGDDGSKA